MNTTSGSDHLADALAWLDGHVNYETTGPQRGGGSLTHDPDRRLRHLRTFMDLMGDPQTTYPAFHLTGTNGKTSTARLVTALLAANGLTTGTYTSPHLERVNERIQLNGEPLHDDDLAEVLQAVRLVEPLLEGDTPSYFELMTAAALRQFSDAAVDAAVVEVGVGGRWDATNVIDGRVAIVTNIELDHQGYLGSTREAIAEQKAGIIKPGATLVLGEDDPDLLPIFEAQEPGRTLLAGRDFTVERNDVAVGGRMLDLRTPSDHYTDVFLSLHGAHQAANAAMALAAVEAFFEAPLHDSVVRAAFEAVTVPGRMEVVHRQPLCLLDGAHNVAGAEALAATVGGEFHMAPHRVLVVGLLAGHDPSEMLTALGANDAKLVVACTAPSPRAIPASEIAAAARQIGAPTVAVDTVEQAVDEAMAAAADDELVLVTGSLYVVGAARRHLRHPS